MCNQRPFRDKRPGTRSPAETQSMSERCRSALSWPVRVQCKRTYRSCRGISAFDGRSTGHPSILHRILLDLDECLAQHQSLVT